MSHRNSIHARTLALAFAALAAGGALLIGGGHDSAAAAPGFRSDPPSGRLASAPNDIFNDGEFHARVNNAFGVASSELQFIDLGDAQPGESFMVFMELEGEPVVLDLFPHSNRSSRYQVLRQVGPDPTDLVVAEPGPIRTMRGDIIGVPSSWVAGSLMTYGFEAHIAVMDGIDYWIEPVAKKMPDVDPGMYILYRSDQSLPTDLRCGNDDFTDLVDPDHDSRPNQSPASMGGTIFVTELACDADHEFFLFHGSTPAVEAKINSIINTMNAQYERDVAIRHDITTIIVRENVNDPYNNTRKPDKLLDQFKNEWNANQTGIVRDVAHLYTGRDILGTTVGLAFVGVICSPTFGYSFVQELSSFGFNFETDLSAHELGHNWSANHCSCPTFTMNPSLPGTNTFNPVGTIPDITAHRDSRTCLVQDQGAVTLNVTRFKVLKGSHAGGSANSMQTSDNRYLKVNSTRGGRRKANLRIDLRSSTKLITRLDLDVEVASSKTGGKTVVFLWQWVQRRWIKIGSFNQPKSDTLKQFNRVSTPQRFVDSAGRVRVRIQTKNRANDFTQKVDLVMVDVLPQ